MRPTSLPILASVVVWAASSASASEFQKAGPASSLWNRPPPGVSLVFDEEFDGPAIDSAKWATTYADGARTKPTEQETYVDADFLRSKGLEPSKSPFSFGRGILSIEARRLSESDSKALGTNFSSGLISTWGKRDFRYGYFEMRARLPKGAGLWPAFWLFRSGSEKPYGEIDVMEALGHDPSVIFATTHAGPDWAARKMSQVRYASDKPMSDGYHTYGVDWNEKVIRFFVDGRPTMSVSTPDELKQPMYLLANLTVGGEWGRKPDVSAFPARYRIDYIRVWNRAK